MNDTSVANRIVLSGAEELRLSRRLAGLWPAGRRRRRRVGEGGCRRSAAELLFGGCRTRGCRATRASRRPHGHLRALLPWGWGGTCCRLVRCCAWTGGSRVAAARALQSERRGCIVPARRFGMGAEVARKLAGRSLGAALWARDRAALGAIASAAVPWLRGRWRHSWWRQRASKPQQPTPELTRGRKEGRTVGTGGGELGTGPPGRYPHERAQPLALCGGYGSPTERQVDRERGMSVEVPFGIGRSSMSVRGRSRRRASPTSRARSTGGGGRAGHAHIAGGPAPAALPATWTVPQGRPGHRGERPASELPVPPERGGGASSIAAGFSRQTRPEPGCLMGPRQAPRRRWAFGRSGEPARGPSLNRKR